MNNLNKRKALAARVLGVGKNKIIFDIASLAEIKEAITKQDIKDMYAQGIIMIRTARGTKKKVKRKTKRGFGKIKLIVHHKKRKYMFNVRKLRNYLKELKLQGKVADDHYHELRKKIRAKAFRDKAHLKEHMESGGLIKK